MKTIQEAKSESYVRVIDYCVRYNTMLALISGFIAEKNKLQAVMLSIQESANKQLVELGGIVKEAKIAQSNMADVVIQYALIGAVEARNAGNETLDEQLSHYKTFITHASKVTSITRANDIRDALNDNLHTIPNPSGIIHNVTPANIADIDAAILAYQNLRELPKEAIITRKTQGTEMLPPEFKTADDAVINMNDLIYAHFYVTKPEMVREFAASKKLAIYGVRHTGLLVHAKDANPPEGAITDAIEKLLVKIVEIDRSAITDIYGFAGITQFKQGTYHVEFSGTGWKTKEMIIEFKRGKMVEMEVEMERE